MERRRFKLLLTSLVALVAIQMQAEAQQLPRLVVCITVDQLRTDYLKALEPMMGPGGMRRILREGKVYEDVDFPLYQPSVASATASLFTGVYPSQHGLETAEVYLRDKGKEMPIFWDDNYIGNYTRDNFSPRALLVETLGDRLKDASGGAALVYSIAPHAEAAIASGGLQADGVYWLDKHIGSWASSNYYGAMLPALEQYNRSAEGPNKRLIAGLQWRPLRDYVRAEIGYGDWAQSFTYRYTLREAAAFRESALANEEVTALAVRLLESAGYERRQSPGLLALGYTVRPQRSEELSVSDVDTYLRLDKQIERLLQALDKTVGLKNCLVTLSGTGYTSYQLRTGDSGSRLKRSLNVSRITALTNMYLTALYGSGSWVSRHSNGRLYLDRKLIESRKLDLARVQEQVASFLSGSEGLDYAVPATVLARATREDYVRITHSVHPRYEADVYWAALPSWHIEDIKDHPQLEPRSLAVPSPFIMMGVGIVPEQFGYEVRDVRDVVRAICSVLRIRPPTA